MSNMTMRGEGSIDDFGTALGAAYERYMGRLRMLERLRRQGEEEYGVKFAPQLAHAQSLVEEAYTHWRTLAELHLSAAERAYDVRPRHA